jgi:hypothetical protein
MNSYLKFDATLLLERFNNDVDLATPSLYKKKAYFIRRMMKPFRHIYIGYLRSKPEIPGFTK